MSEDNMKSLCVESNRVLKAVLMHVCVVCVCSVCGVQCVWCAVLMLCVNACLCVESNRVLRAVCVCVCSFYRGWGCGGGSLFISRGLLLQTVHLNGNSGWVN